MDILSVTESMVRLLRLEIITGQILPGSKLNEIELSTRYGVSRPPLREAFRRLENEKLVITIPRKGAYVSKLSIEDCKHVYYVRYVLECAAIDTFSEDKDYDFNAIRQAISKEKDTLIPGSDDAEGLMNYYIDISKFHWLLVATSRNRWLQHCYQTIGATLTRYQIIYYTIPGTRRPAIQDHGDILDLIESERYQEAKTLLVSHIVDGLNKLIDKMRVNKLCENYDDSIGEPCP
jgi:DNA-binding GntR family transcriptional regulator